MNNKIGLILTIFSLGVLSFGFYQLFEPYDETEDLGWDTAAQRNPFLAAEHYLRHGQVDVKSYDNFEKFEQLSADGTLDKDAPFNGTLFISNSSSVLSNNKVNELLAWVKQGGHLIVAADSSGMDASDKLLARFSIQVLPTDYQKRQAEKNNAEIKECQNEAQKPQNNSGDADKDKKAHKKLSEILRERNEHIVQQRKDQQRKEPKQSPENKNEEIPDAELSTLTFSDMQEQLKIHFSPHHQLHHPYFDIENGEQYEEDHPFYWDGSELGVHFMQFEVGEGMLSVLSDGDIWRSDHIAQLDHAFLLTVLTQNKKGMRIIYGAEIPSIFVLLWNNGQQILISSSILLLVWLVYRSRRFGVIQTEQSTVRRSLAEHIDASANYLWREKDIDELLKPLRADIEHQALCKIAIYKLLKPEQRFQSLSEISGIPLNAVEQAMTVSAADKRVEIEKRKPQTKFQRNRNNLSEENFLQIVQSLQHIRNSL